MKTQARLDENKRQALAILNWIAGVFAMLLLSAYGVMALGIAVWMCLAMFGDRI